MEQSTKDIYPAGTVAVATVRGVKGVRVMRCGDGDGRRRGFWWSPEYLGDTSRNEPQWRVHKDEHVTDVRPLVVLDLDESVGKSMLADWLRNNVAKVEEGCVSPTSIGKDMRWLADQIEAQTKPRVAEPQRCGAMVIAAQKGEDEGSERGWVRFRHGKTKCWIDSLEHVRSWDDLDNPELQECEVSS